MVPPHHSEYVRYSGLVNAIYQRYTDQVEPCSIDESWLDVTGSRALFGSGEEIANSIRTAVREELGITISVGVSFNKIFAKMGSDYKKPDATTIITRENYRQILWPLPISDLLMVGKSSRTALRELGNLYHWRSGSYRPKHSVAAARQAWRHSFRLCPRRGEQHGCFYL